MSDSEEEILVYADFSDNVNVNKYRSVHVLGVDSKNPIIQADETFFTCEYTHALGTYMFFEEDAEPHSADPLFDKLPEKSLKYVCKTLKRLNVDVAYVMPKEDTDDSIKVRAEESNRNDIQEVNFKSIEEGLSKFRGVLVPNTETDLDTNLHLAMDQADE